MGHATSLRIGLIADTHGLLRPEALTALSGCDRIIHAGDIGNPEILDALGRLAPLQVVRGNNDLADWAAKLPQRLNLRCGAIGIHVLHDLKELAINPVAENIDVVIAGHSHKPLLETRNGVLYINPGSAGPRRFKLPISVGYLHIEAGGGVRGELRQLES